MFLLIIAPTHFSLSMFIHSRNTRYLKLDSGIISFAKRVITDAWTEQIISVST